MKFFYLSLVVLLAPFMGLAQSKYAALDEEALRKVFSTKTVYHLKGGITFPQLRSTGGGSAMSNQIFGTNTSFYLGATAGVPLVSLGPVPIYFEPGIMFIGKGGTIDFAFTTDDATLNWRAVSSSNRLDSYNLQVPFNLATQLKLGPGKFMVSFGPFVSLALGGSFISDITFDDMNGIRHINSDRRTLKFGTASSSSDIYRMEVGMNFNVGYQRKNWSLLVGFESNFTGHDDLSLSTFDLGSSYGEARSSSPHTLKSTLVSIGVGYSF